MAKTSYFAIDANGKKHTRNSERAYTHTVVYQSIKSEGMDCALSPEWRKTEKKNYDYSVSCIENGKHKNLMSFEHYRNDAARHAKDVEESVDFLRGAKSFEEFAEARKAERVAAVEARDYSIWHNAGWCGRLDLAQKLAAKYTGAKILEVQK